MEFKWLLLIIVFIIVVPHISAVDTGDWQEISVNNVNFKIPERFSNGTFDKLNNSYTQGEQMFFHITSLVKYESLKSVYGVFSTSTDIRDIEEREIAGHDAVIIYDHNNYYDYDYISVFFTTGNKIFRIGYPSSEVTPELVEIINSTPKSEMSKETFLNKLDNAQRDYIEEDRQKNLELDLEEFYRDYNDQHRRESFWYWGSNGFGIGGSTRL